MFFFFFLSQAMFIFPLVLGMVMAQSIPSVPICSPPPPPPGYLAANALRWGWAFLKKTHAGAHKWGANAPLRDNPKIVFSCK